MNNLLNFKSFFKFLGRNKAYTLIDVFGLSVSLMFVLLIAVYTVQEMSTDKFHTKADRIYLVGNENWMATGAAIPYKIKERYPEVEKVCPVVADNSSNIVVVSGDRKLKANVMFADSTFFDFFDFRLINFPIFNVADIYVTVSMIVLILLCAFYYHDHEIDVLFSKSKKD